MLVDTFLAEAAQQFPDKVGLVSGQRRVTYRQLDEAANAVAAGLRALGVLPGDRIVIHLENGVEAVLSIFGALRADAVFVPVNPTVKAEKLAYVVNNCGAAILISDQHWDGTAAGASGAISGVKAVVRVGGRPSDSAWDGRPVTSFDALLDAGRGGPPPVARGINLNLAALVYTSGSTRRPRGVMLTHGNIVSAAASIADYLELTSDDVILNVLPLSFDYGLYQVLLSCKSGGCLVLERAFVYPSTVLDTIARERVTGLPIVPMMAALLLKQDLTAYDISSLRYISNTGAVLQPSHIEALRARMPHVRIFSMYGLTECKRVSYLAPEEIDRRPTSVGKPMDNVEVYLVAEDGRQLDAGVGELVIRGSNVMQGYWGAPEDTARVLKPGRYPGEFVLYSGDIFRIDEEGYMYFLNRTDDVIKSRGQKVSPREVESVLHAAPGVLEAFVLPIPDPVLGDAIKAYVTLDGSQAVTEQEIVRYCTGNLEDFMVPKSVQIVERLPRTSSGKIARQALRIPETN